MKKRINILLFFTVIFNIHQPLTSQNNNSLKGKKIALIIAENGFRDEEYAEPKKYFLENEAIVITASTTTEKATGSRGMIAKPDMLLKDLNVSNYDAIVFVGGAGARKYYYDQDALRIAKEANSKQKVVAAICIAPNILCKAGILKGKNATAWAFEVSGCEAVELNKSVVHDGNIVTANGPDAALDFAITIEKAIRDKK